MNVKLVMVIDDSEADQFLAKSILRRFDNSIEVVQAYDGVEALSLLTDMATPPDVIFLDINMPRMNGHEFLKEYDQWSNRSAVVIMLTSSEQDKDIAKAEKMQCVYKYCTKPLDKNDLESISEV